MWTWLEPIFEWSNLYVMPFWVLMVFLPRWRWTQRLMQGTWMVLLLAMVYTGFMASIVFYGDAAGLFSTLTSPKLPVLVKMFGTPLGTTIGWLHFLAFDLFVGRWIYLRSLERRQSAWWVSICLFLTLMMGPLGLLAYLTVCEVQTWSQRGRSSEQATVAD
ncbi:MAG: ABA4-like family protein [Myxococcota bacterium]